MEEEVSARILGLLDLLAVDVTKHRQETGSLRREMHAGFDRIDRRFDRLETRVEVVETKVGRLETKVGRLETKVDRLETKVDRLETKVDDLETKVGAIGSELHDFRGEFELRIAPLER